MCGWRSGPAPQSLDRGSLSTPSSPHAVSSPRPDRHTLLTDKVRRHCKVYIINYCKWRHRRDASFCFVSSRLYRFVSERVSLQWWRSPAVRACHSGKTRCLLIPCLFESKARARSRAHACSLTASGEMFFFQIFTD